MKKYNILCLKKPLLVVTIAIQALTTAYAQWPAIPDPNVAVTNQAATTDAARFWAAPDGVGGSYAVWEDDRNNPGGKSGIFCQRITNVGLTKFIANGITISDVAGSNQKRPSAAAGTNSAVLIVWEDERNTGTTKDDIYAKSVDSVSTTLWGGANGILICNAADKQERPQIVSDGAGGAIIAWRDKRTGGVEDIYAQRISSSGVAQWTANGVAITTATGKQSGFHLIADESGGAIIAWEDDRNATTDIFIQKINASGVVQWTTDGVAICTAIDNQKKPQIVTDGAGGAIIAWEDKRSGTEDIYAQRIISAGTVSWTTNGVQVCGATDKQTRPSIVSDLSGGAIIVWEDKRTAGVEDIYAQRITSTGAIAAGSWIADGIIVTAATGVQKRVHASTTDVGAALVAWEDNSLGDTNIYVEAILKDGTLVIVPAGGGRQITSNTNTQARPFIFQNSNDEWITLWEDDRNNPGNNNDVYAQGINGTIIPEIDGPLPIELSFFKATVEQNIVFLQWQTVSESNNDYFTIERSVAGINWQEIVKIDGAGDSKSLRSYSYADKNPYFGISYYRLKQVDFDGAFSYSEIVLAKVDSNVKISIYPNPATNILTITGNNIGESDFTFLDYTGSIVYLIPNSFEHNQAIFDISGLSKGMYFIRLQNGQNMVVKRLNIQ